MKSSFGGILMFKRVLSLFLCVIFAVSLLASCAQTATDGAVSYGFGDRILYGGNAVDVDGGTVISEEGSVFFADRSGNKTLLAEYDAKYLNYYGEKLYFVSGNEIKRANADMSGIETLLSFDDGVKCLYATDDGLLQPVLNSGFNKLRFF